MMYSYTCQAIGIRPHRNPMKGRHMVRTYLDFKGRAQYAVDGPNGTYLVTRKSMHEDYEVWRSDSIRTAGKAATFEAALARARGLAGIEA